MVEEIFYDNVWQMVLMLNAVPSSRQMIINKLILI